MNAQAIIKPVKVIRWSKLIDELFDARVGYESFENKAGLLRYIIDDLADGRKPTRIEQDKLKMLAGHHVTIANILKCGFDWADIDDMCLITHCTDTQVQRVKVPIYAFRS